LLHWTRRLSKPLRVVNVNSTLGANLTNLNRKLEGTIRELTELNDFITAVNVAEAARKSPVTAERYTNTDEARQTAIARVAAIPYKERANWRNYNNVSLITSEIAKREGKALEQVETELLAQMREMGIRGI
jgi:hypothetical protein